MNPILNAEPLSFPWATVDPFLFCVLHDDRYPKSNGRYGPAASLADHRIGQDFVNADGWRMYHGTTVPGFPAHPHRGFETVTFVQRGLIDHSDSLGAAARYGPGDVQWLTAGSGVVHAEMFPLLDTEAPNPLKFFQIWLNLPARSKFATPRFSMFWAEDIPRHSVTSPSGARTEVICVAGQLVAGLNIEPLVPPPDSWAAASDSDLAVWTVKMEPGALWTLPPARGLGTRRHLYFYAGDQASVANQPLKGQVVVELDATQPVALKNTGVRSAEFLMLQGRPIGEPLVQAGPFVMNTESEVQQAFADFQRTKFGDWPWPDRAPVHGADPTRFARYADGSEQRRSAR